MARGGEDLTGWCGHCSDRVGARELDEGSELAADQTPRCQQCGFILVAIRREATPEDPDERPYLWDLEDD